MWRRVRPYGHGMQQCHTVVRQQAGDLFKKLPVLANAHMFKHADGDNTVKPTVRIPVILQFKPHPVLEAALQRPLGCKGVLVLPTR